MLISPMPNHTVVRVRGDAPLAFLDATTTQAVADLQPGTGALACLLDATGHVLAEFRVLPLQDGDVLLDGEPASRDALTGWLARVAPLSGCEVLDESDQWNVFARRGQQPSGEHVVHESDDEIVVGVTWGAPGIDVLARASMPAAVDAVEIERARIAAIRPRFGVDVTSALILNETPLLLRAVSFTKGCYPGQETVAKIRNLGRARRAVVRVDADIALELGARITLGDREVGTVTSALENAGIATVRAEAITSLDATIDGQPVRFATDE